MHQLIDRDNPRSLAKEEFAGDSARPPVCAHSHMALLDIRSHPALQIQKWREYGDVRVKQLAPFHDGNAPESQYIGEVREKRHVKRPLQRPDAESVSAAPGTLLPYFPGQ